MNNNTHNNKYDGIIFDVDGTVWDSTDTVEKAWNKAFAELGLEERVSSNTLKSLFGLHLDVIIEKVLPNASAAERKALAPLIYQYEHDFLEEEGGRVYDGFASMLEALSARYPLYIVSNCQAGYIEQMLRMTKLQSFFKDHLCPGDNNLLKADNIKLIAKRNGLKNPVYVGDTSFDQEACKEAEVPFIYAAYGFGKVDLDACAGVINTPMELVNILD